MKNRRVWVLLIGLALVLSLCACGKDKEPKTETPASTPTEEQKPPVDNPGDEKPTPGGEQIVPDAPQSKEPEVYDFGLKVKINPEFMLYVADEEVIAYEALNEDAKKVEQRCALVGRDIEAALDDIVRFSHDEGYLKDAGEVNLTIVNANAPKSEGDEILKKAEHAVQDCAARNGFTAVPKTEVDASVQFEPEPEDPEDPNQPGPDDPNQPGPDDPNEPGGEPRKKEGCSVCWGTGVCERCDGTGEVECLRCHGEDKDCDDCHGTGKSVCEQCHGTKKCPACGGTGEKPDD